jgi:hypothetical protein
MPMRWWTHRVRQLLFVDQRRSPGRRPETGPSDRPNKPTRLHRLVLLGLTLILATPMWASWVPVRQAKAAGSCPDNSTWGVKVGSDSQASQINLNAPPTPTSVFQLGSIPLPSPISHRVSPTEFTVYVTTDAILNSGEPHIEHDADTHLGFHDSTGDPGSGTGVPGHYAIAEIPDVNLGPVPTCSVFYAGIQRAHQKVDAWQAAGGVSPVPIVITGVGFFDGNTGQSDQSPNQIELHSVLDLNINPGSITGRITTSGGGNISGASVSDGVDPAVSTDSNGLYTIPKVAANASYTVTASAGGFVSQSRSVTVNYGTASTSNFTLSPLLGSVTGTVTSASSGGAIVGATVSDSGGASTTTNASGIYTLAGLAPGSHALTAAAAGYNSATETALVTSGTTQNLSFSLTPTPTTGAVTGKVTNSSGGAPIVGAAVSDSGGATTTTDNSGVYTLNGLSPGGHSVTAAAAGFTPQTEPVSVTAGVTTTNLNFNVTANTSSGAISGTVTSASGGTAISGATVSDSGGASSTTNSSGVYTLAGLSPGSHTLTASAGGFTSATQTASVTAGTTQNLAFSLSPAPTTGAVTGAITSASGGTPIGGATVSDSGGAGTTANSSGTYTLAGLAQGSHTLTVSAPGFTPQAQTVSVTAGTTQNMSFSLTSGPPPTGTITGTVMATSGGTAISGATVTDSAGATVTTNGSGAYTLSGLPPGSHSLTASATGFTSQVQTATVTAGTAQTIGFSLTMAPTTGAVTGSVTSAPGGAGISGATVTDAGGASTTTSPSGTYSLNGLAPGSHTLIAAASGFSSATQAVSITTGTTQNAGFSMIPSPSTGGVTGTIANASGGSVIAGAIVSDSSGATATTSASGNYTLNGLAPGSHTLNASASGFNSVAQTASVTAGNTQNVSFSLTPAATSGAITGTVTSASSGAPLMAATVSDSGGASASTDGAGVYTISGLVPGSHSLTVSAPGFSSQTEAASVSAGSTRNLSLSLTPAPTTGAITGTVTSAAGGAAVAGATITDSAGASTTSDSSGVYTLTGLAAGNHTLTASAAGFGSGTQTASVTAGATIQGVNFSLTPSPGTVSGTVTRAVDGTAIAGAMVTDSQGASTTTDGTGLYSLTGLSPGSYTLSATAAAFSSATQTASVTAGGTTTGVNFGLTPTPASGAISGTVTIASSGLAVSGATVSDSGGATASTDSSGAYTLVGLSPGTRSITASASNFASQTQAVTVSSGQTTANVNFGLSPSPTGTVSGMVTRASDGAAILGATVSDSGAASTTTDASGSFTLTGLAPGSHNLTAASAGFVSVTQAASVTAGTTQTVSFSLSPSPTTGGVTGTVVSATGGAVIAGATVSESGGGSVVSDSSGLYTLTGLAPGSHTLTATAAGFISGTQAAPVTVGQTTQNVNFSLAPKPTTGAVRGTLTSSSGGAVISGATVSDSGGASAVTDSSGAYTINGLTPGAHSLTAAATNFTGGTQTASVAAGTTLNLNFSLTPAPTSGAITGTVSSSSGGGVIVGASIIDSGGGSTSTGASGVYTLAGLAPGSHTVTVSATGYTSQVQSAVVAAGSTQNISFSLTVSPAAGAITGTVNNASGGSAIMGAVVSDSGGASATTDASGTYTLAGLTPGSHTLTASATGFTSQAQTTSVTTAATGTVSFSLTPSSTTGSVTGTISSAVGGAGISGATVSDSGGASTSSDTSGNYSLAGLTPGSHTLTASAPNFTSGTVTAAIAAGGTATGNNLVLTPIPSTATVTGAVTNASGGVGVSGATVSDSGGGSAVASSSGSYTLAGLSPGSHTLTAAAPGFASASQTVSLTAGTSQNVGFSLTPSSTTGTATGPVTSASGGGPIAGATVTDAGGASTTTNPSGVYTLAGLAPGSHTLTAATAGFTPQTQTASVTAGGTSQGVGFSLTPSPTTGAVTGVVASASGGAPIAAATVTDSGGASATTNGSGVYTLTALAPGSHNLTATAAGFSAQTQTASVTAGNTLNVSFSLGPTPSTGAISGTISSAANGAAIAGVTVIDSGGTTATTNGSGVYALNGLAPGNHTLTTSANGYTSQGQAAAVTAGTIQNANFSLTPTASIVPQLVQSGGATEASPSATLTATLPTSTAAGHLLVLSASVYSASAAPISSVTDSGGNTWSRIGAFAVAGQYSAGEMWYAANAGAATSVTAHLTSAAIASLEVQEFSGVATIAALDGSIGAANRSTSPASGSVAPTAGTDLMVGFLAGHGNAQAMSTTSTGYSALAQQTSDGGSGVIASVVTGYRTLTSNSAQSFTGSFSASMYWAAGMAGFKAATVPASVGLLRVTSSPALPSQVLVDGQLADSWGLNWLELAPGTHALTFAHVPGWTEPAPRTVTVNAGATTTVVGTFIQRGQLRVITSPAVPSQISVDGNPTDDWGMWTDIPTGSHTVCFGAVAGYDPPACQTATVAAGATTIITGAFTANTSAQAQGGVGFLRVVTSPAVPSQIIITRSGGSPYIADSWGLNWLELAPATYTVSFGHTQGYTEPAPQTITITAGNTTVVTGALTQRGLLRVTTSPPVPAAILVDGVPRDDWGMWTDIPTGSHTVCFGSATGYANTPACQTITVNPGVETDVTGSYS